MRYLDPIAAIIAGACTLVALVAGVPVVGAVGIGAAALLIADAGRIAEMRRASAAPPLPAPVPTPLHPHEEAWIRRSVAAVTAIRRNMQLLQPGPVRDRLGDVAAEAERVLEDLRRLAAQVGATRQASSRLDLPRLSEDLTRLTRTLQRGGDPELERDLRRSVDAVREQLRIGRRLASARAALQARIESGGLGLLQLAAQVGELTALAPSGGSARAGVRIDELTTQLEALRAGLSDAGAMSDRALGAMDTEGGSDVPVVP